MALRENSELEEIRRLHRFKSHAQPIASALGPELVNFFKHSVEKKKGKLAKIAECWTALVPPLLCEHCALESFSRGVLTVIVDSSSHLYELKQVLLAGLEKQLLFACKTSGLRKIALRPGRWYDGDTPAERRLR